MKNLWDPDHPLAQGDALDQCVYGSRLLGGDHEAVLHGGGNTSVKIDQPDLFGEMQRVLYVKGSGHNLETIGRDGFAPVDLQRVAKLVELDELSDTEMMNALRTACLRADAPAPSVESILHAILPATAVEHTHPDAVLAVTNTENGAERARDLYGDDVIILPYEMPGFDLAQQAAAALAAEYTPGMRRMVLLNHGLFTFGDTTKSAYDDMVDMITMAEEYLEAEGINPSGTPQTPTPCPFCDRTAISGLRRDMSAHAGRPLLVHQHHDQRTWAFSQRTDLDRVARQGPATPDHVLFTKRLPMLGRDVNGYAADYTAEFDAFNGDQNLTMLDPAPRVILDPELGMLTAGRDVKSYVAARDIAKHTVNTIERAERIGGYHALPANDILSVEYWELEQAKLSRAARHDLEFQGEVAIVTGAASGIGRGCVDKLLARGAAVVGFDVNESVINTFDTPAYLGVQVDVTSTDAIDAGLDAAVAAFGGVDMVVAAAGMFPNSTPVAELDRTGWRAALDVNVTGLAELMSMVHPLLVDAPRGGRVVIIGSKNVAAPGPGAAAYSASKAAANQLARVIAMEWAPDNIRVNNVHPDAVFDTGLWTDDLLAARADRYGMTVDEYKRRNLLSTEITSADIAAVTARLLSTEFGAVTGGHLSIDGGNDRTI